MGFLFKVGVFLLREITQPTLEEAGRKIGIAVGTRIGKKIEPTAFDDNKEEEEVAEDGPEDDSDGNPDK